MEGAEASGLRMKAEGLLLEKLAQPNEAASAGERHSLEREIFYYRLDPLYASLAVFVAAFVCLLLCALFRPAANAPLWRRFLRPAGSALRGCWVRRGPACWRRPWSSACSSP